MLILIGTVPTTYALNHAVTARQSQDFVAVSRAGCGHVGQVCGECGGGGGSPRRRDGFYPHERIQTNTMLALRVLVNDIGTEMAQFKELAKVPRTQVRNFRNDMYLVSEALRLMQKRGNPLWRPRTWRC